MNQTVKSRRGLGLAILGFLILLAFLHGTSPSDAQKGAGSRALPEATPTATLPLSAYQTIDVRELKKNPDAYAGKPVKLAGEIFSITEKAGKTGLQMWVSIPGGSEFDREAVQVSYDGTLPGVYEKTAIVVYGMGAGDMSGSNAFGATVHEPAIDAQTITH